MSKTYIPERAMAIFAHPDDIEFSCAGTLARWAKEGCKISYVNLTSGDVGIADPNISKDEAVAIRERESKAAAGVLGVEETIFMGEPDGMLQPSMELRSLDQRPDLSHREDRGTPNPQPDHHPGFDK